MMSLEAIRFPDQSQRSGTWYEGLPLLGNDLNVAKAKALSNDNTIKISVGEIIVELKEAVVESRVPSN